MLAVEAFDPAIRDGLVEFFQRALHRDSRQRFASLKEMRDGWLQVFRRLGRRRRRCRTEPPGRREPEIVADDVEVAEAARDEAAALAPPGPPCWRPPGLTPRAVSAAHRLDAITVGELLAVAEQARAPAAAWGRRPARSCSAGSRSGVPGSASGSSSHHGRRPQARSPRRGAPPATAAGDDDAESVAGRPGRDRAAAARRASNGRNRSRGRGHPAAAAPARRVRCTCRRCRRGRSSRRWPRRLGVTAGADRRRSSASSGSAGTASRSIGSVRAQIIELLRGRRPGDGRRRAGGGGARQPRFGAHR